MNPALGMSDSEPHLGQLEIAHVLFIDIVSYSQLPTDHQIQAIERLQKIVRISFPEFEKDLADGQVIILPTGDGMVLAFFRDPIAPLCCARQISILLKSRAGDFQVRMGIHHGPIFRLADINANANVAGSGINLAQRVMDCGDGGHILASKAVADVLLQLTEWKATVHELGVTVVKHGVQIELFNIFGETFGNPQIPSKLESACPKAVSERALDIAIGREIPIHEPTELIAMVRQLQSDGLARILEDDKDFTVGAEDIRSKPVTLEFSVGRNGKPSPLDLAISVTAPDFEPTSQSKIIRIPPFADSETCTFLLTPRQLGELRVTVELYTGNVALLSRLLRTHAKTSDRLPPDLARVVVHVPLTVLVRPEWSVAEDNIREVVSRCLAEVRNLQAAGDLESALARVERFLTLHPDDERLLRLQSSLQHSAREREDRRRTELAESAKSGAIPGDPEIGSVAAEVQLASIASRSRLTEADDTIVPHIGIVSTGQDDDKVPTSPPAEAPNPPAGPPSAAHSPPQAPSNAAPASPRSAILPVAKVAVITIVATLTFFAVVTVRKLEVKSAAVPKGEASYSPPAPDLHQGSQAIASTTDLNWWFENPSQVKNAGGWFEGVGSSEYVYLNPGAPRAFELDFAPQEQQAESARHKKVAWVIDFENEHHKVVYQFDGRKLARRAVSDRKSVTATILCPVEGVFRFQVTIEPGSVSVFSPDCNQTDTYSSPKQDLTKGKIGIKTGWRFLIRQLRY